MSSSPMRSFLHMCAVSFLTCASFFALSGCGIDASGLVGEKNDEQITGNFGANGVDGAAPEYPSELDSFYTQKLQWKSCDGQFVCAKATMPINYEDPSGATLTLALEKRPAQGKKIGTLFVNPGGPGGSGIDMAKNAESYFSPAILSSFDIVGFDPRGVGSSTPIDCVSDARLGELLDMSIDYSQSDALEKAKAVNEEVAAGCQEKSGDILPFVGTVNVARDLDVLRALVGDPRLYYVGYSYGTFLGAQYAHLFPTHVGRMILDGAMDPSLGSLQISVDQTRGFEQALSRFFDWCFEGGQCTFASSPTQGKELVKKAIDSSLTAPFPTHDPARPLTQSALIYGIVMPLYNNSNWSYLVTALDALLQKNDGSVLQALADAMNEREENGSFTSNSTEANWAINCADYLPVDPQAAAQASSELKGEASVLGDFQTEGPDLCASWPSHPSENPPVMSAPEAPPIVIVGTKYDPATPYEWAVKLNEQIDNSVLVTWNGDGHTAYGRSSACIRGPLDQYLLKGRVPDSITCEPERS